MEHEDMRRFLSIKRCDTLLKEQKFPGTAVRLSVKRLAVVCGELEQLLEDEKDAKRLTPWDGKEIRKRSRNLRTEYLSTIARAARAIDGFVKHTPGAAEALKVPHQTDSAALHVEAGDRFVKFLKTHRVNFLRETGFDRNLLSKLRAATDELRTQSAFAHTTRRQRSSVLRAIKRRLTQGRAQIDLLTRLLEPFLIERKLEGAWAQASRVGPKKGRPRDTPEQRAQKRLVKAAQKVQKLEQQRLNREAAKQARRAKKLATEALKKARPNRAQPAQPAPPAPPAPPPAQPGEPPLTKALFLDRLAEQGAEIER